ncbi:bifunctional phosphoribosylaminoimidazolecarboxamide formyltransferase/IMP cyclohydrolase, partial [Patescibacteria group bacterium]|nr:bifunctional phosphoribosylaminoimidazolecarboxamide formyltransferase/IMP cyclohydrolase [Patescibacteria group bacterium]
MKAGSKFSKTYSLKGKKIIDLRYGENPHQKASLYITDPNSPMANLKFHGGRGSSLINLTDVNAGLEVVRMFKEPAAVVIKHNSPCGIALGDTVAQALERAIEADSESAFGGIIVI